MRVQVPVARIADIARPTMARPIGGIGSNSFESQICAAQAASFHFGRASP